MGAFECRPFRLRIFSDLEPIAIDLGQRYAKTAERFSYVHANRELLDIHERLRIHDLNLCADTEELRAAARACANRCSFIRQEAPTPFEAHQGCLRIVERYRLTPPRVKEGDLEPALNRMCDARWWFRKIQTLRLQTFEAVARDIELVTRCRGAYASDYTVRLKRRQREQSRLYLESTFVGNEEGQTYSLQELADLSVSNPAIRRAELMVRIKGFEMVAGLLGDVGEFYTLTTPSRMHACLHDGQGNPRYDGTNPHQAQVYLTHLWTLIRSELRRQGIRPYGFRVVEPHHDGTPHWHLLLFMPAEQAAIVRAVMRRYALADNGDEPGAQQHRFKAVAIDPAQGSATGYVAKYVAKNIDGHGLETDRVGNDASEAAERITAWASTWSIRQFQQIGGPSVTVWRQLRKLEKGDDEDLETLRTAATAGDWAAYMLAMGGPSIARCARPAKPLYGLGRQLHPATGEIVYRTRGQYGDPAPRRVTGITHRDTPHDTRKHFWTVAHKGSAAGEGGRAGTAPRPAAQLPTMDDPSAMEAAPLLLSPPGSSTSRAPVPGSNGAVFPWTCINNCTDSREGAPWTH